MIVLTATQALVAKSTFIGFAIRDIGLTRAQATEEVARLFANPVRPVKREHYLTVFRAGAPFTLTRAARQSVYMTFENAINHATS